MWARLSSIIILTFIIGCTTEDSANVATGGRISPTYAGPAELAYCSTVITYSAPNKVTVSGTAEYTRRNPWGTAGVGSGGLGGALTSSTHAATVHPIRHAEIRVTDAAGNVVQCGETSATGTFSLDLPLGNTNYTLSVNSRSYNSYLRASVLNRPEQNVFYSLQTSVNASTDSSGLALMAAAGGTQVLGAAFNILDQLHNANDYLRTKVSSCNATFNGCRDVSLASPIGKVVAYWEKGYNPNGYFGSDRGLSFYLPGYSRLFISGGLNGDVDNSDSDHFDNSVIVHEYGHFLEDTVFASDSPGGSHNGDAIIDPRLAWSEGWGNFFQGAVRGNARYVDTSGNDDGTTRLFYDADLENEQVGIDTVTEANQGNFREFSVTRMLWDVTDNTPGESVHGASDDVVDTATHGFMEIWAALTKTSNGFRDTDWAFRNVGHLHYAQQMLGAGSTSWANPRTVNWHRGGTTDFANFVKLEGSGGTCNYIASAGAPANIPANTYTQSLTPVASSSDLLNNFDFYHVKITSSGTYTFTLTYQDANGAGTVADLDLYLYGETADLSDSSTILKYSRATPTGAVNTAKTETITIALTPGNYLLMVTAYVGSATGTQAYYSIKQGSTQLCPATL